MRKLKVSEILYPNTLAPENTTCLWQRNAEAIVITPEANVSRRKPYSCARVNYEINLCALDLNYVRVLFILGTSKFSHWNLKRFTIRLRLVVHNFIQLYTIV